jgi:hypothetical protein
MITDENFYLRGQAFEILLSITDCDTFDWFQHHGGNTNKRTLHHRLMGLSQHPNFLIGLIENRKKSYPGGSLRALQLLAFWISWVRGVNTTNHILILSDSLLQEIKLWSQGQGEDLCEDEINLAKTVYLDFSYEQFHREDSADAKTGMGTGERSPQLQLSDSDSGASCNTVDTSLSNTDIGTNTAYNAVSDRPAVFVSGFETSDYEGCDTDTDTNRTLPSLRLNEDGILESSDSVRTSIEEISLTTVECEAAVGSEEISVTQSQSQSQPPTLPQCLDELVEKAQSLKIQGNELFKVLKYKESLGFYEEAISLLQPMCDKAFHRNGKEHPLVTVNGVSVSVDEKLKVSPVLGPLMASLHFNCATANWKLSELKEAVPSSAGRTPLSYETKCELSCKSALTYDKAHCKSVYRLSCVLLQQGRSVEALDAIERYAAASTSELDDTVKAVRRRCLAAAMAKGEGECSTEGTKNPLNPESPVSEAAVAIKKLTLSDRRSTSTDISEAAIGSQAAKVLRALQTRASRGKGQGSSTASAPLSLSSFSARDRKDTTSRSGRVFDEEDNRNLETLLGKPLQLDGDHSRNKGTITSQAIHTSSAQTKKEKVVAKKSPKKADAKTSKVAAMNACEAYNKLKNLSALFERSFSSARELIKGDDRDMDDTSADKKWGPLDDIYDVMDGHVKSAIQVCCLFHEECCFC